LPKRSRAVARGVAVASSVSGDWRWLGHRISFCVVVDDRRDPDAVDVVALVEGLALDVVGVGVRWRPNNMTST
jgi:hypothetical protein